ncbi:hypothetical protein ACCO45_008857 [Purpureocillium lilacinum]|uniref:Uncharacterized protein n=1 Tax=Purpureocillium lilacinum TaxID=33203 RepID=A0ACC4DHZ1_PURLI
MDGMGWSGQDESGCGTAKPAAPIVNSQAGTILGRARLHRSSLPSINLGTAGWEGCRGLASPKPRAPSRTAKGRGAAPRKWLVHVCVPHTIHRKLQVPVCGLCAAGGLAQCVCDGPDRQETLAKAHPPPGAIVFCIVTSANGVVAASSDGILANRLVLDVVDAPEGGLLPPIAAPQAGPKLGVAQQRLCRATRHRWHPAAFATLARRPTSSDGVVAAGLIVRGSLPGERRPPGRMANAGPRG